MLLDVICMTDILLHVSDFLLSKLHCTSLHSWSQTNLLVVETIEMYRLGWISLFLGGGHSNKTFLDDTIPIVLETEFVALIGLVSFHVNLVL